MAILGGKLRKSGKKQIFPAFGRIYSIQYTHGGQRWLLTLPKSETLQQVLWRAPVQNSRPMMANIRMAKDTSSPICMRGARALKIDLRTTCKPKTGGSDVTVWNNLQHKHPWKFVKFVCEVFSYNVHAAYILL